QEYMTVLYGIHTEAERLGHLISDLLALARGDEGQTVFDRDPVRLDRLIQAIMNLLDNALFYTNPGGSVSLTVEASQAQAHMVIRDTGIGIAAEHLPHIFERFYRVDPARTRTGGSSSGLGLSIVEWVVRAHGGTVSVESQLGHGTCFTVTLPLASLTEERTLPLKSLPTYR